MPNIEDQVFPSGGGAVPAVVADPVFSWWGLMGMLLVFVFILFVSLWILKRLNQANVRKMNTPWARVLDQQSLGGRQSLYLVEIAGQLQILGGSDYHLLKIAEINDPDVAADILEEIATRPIERVNGWTKYIQKIPGRFRKKDPFAAEMARLLDEVKR